MPQQKKAAHSELPFNTHYVRVAPTLKQQALSQHPLLP